MGNVTGSSLATLEAAMPDGVARTRIDGPMALFTPERRLISALPVSMYLLELVPGSLRTSYERAPSGVLLHEDDRLFRHTLSIGGYQCRVEVHADQIRGRPSTFDWDYMLGIWRLWQDGAVTPDGLVEGASFRALLRAAGRDGRVSQDEIEASKRALARWAGLHVHTNLEVDLSERARAVGAGSAAALLPESWPVMLERESKHWVLEYDVERETRPSGRRDFIDRLRINPLWLEQANAGKTAWINIDLHNSLTTAPAKRLLQQGTIRASRGEWRLGEPWVVTSRDLHAALGFSAGQRPARVHESLHEAFSALRDRGALHFTARKIRTGTWEYELYMGDEFLVASYYRGITPFDSTTARTLLWHLRAFQLSEREARALLRDHPSQCLDVLRRVFWLLLAHGGRGAPGASSKLVKNWAAWIKKAITEQWTFPELEYRQWVADLASGKATLARSSIAQVAVPSAALATPRASRERKTRAPEAVSPEAVSPPAEAAAAPRPFAPNVWGRTLERFAEIDAQVYRTWLADTWLVSHDPHRTVIGTTNTFAVDWMTERYGAQLQEILTELTGSASQLEFRYFVASEQPDS